ncbi:hypothetical protein PFISCL1PPCAC_17040, partial [Pristionchus fissidentatus]
MMKRLFRISRIGMAFVNISYHCPSDLFPDMFSVLSCVDINSLVNITDQRKIALEKSHPFVTYSILCHLINYNVKVSTIQLNAHFEIEPEEIAELYE